MIEEQEHAVAQGKHLRVHKGDDVRAGEPLVDGRSTRRTSSRISRRRGAVQAYLLREIQNVYRSQGVAIDDKHIEIILGRR